MEYAAADDGSLAACTDCKEATGLHRATEQQVEKEKTAAIPAASTKLTGHSGLQRLSSVCADDVPALPASDRYPPDQASRLPCCLLDHSLLGCFSRRYADCCRFHCSPICLTSASTTVHTWAPCSI